MLSIIYFLLLLFTFITTIINTILIIQLKSDNKNIVFKTNNSMKSFIEDDSKIKKETIITENDDKEYATNNIIGNKKLLKDMEAFIDNIPEENDKDIKSPLEFIDPARKYSGDLNKMDISNTINNFYKD